MNAVMILVVLAGSRFSSCVIAGQKLAGFAVDDRPGFARDERRAVERIGRLLF